MISLLFDRKKWLRGGQYHMTGTLDSLINVMLSLEGGFQSIDNKYIGIKNVITPGRCSFKVIRLLDALPEDGFPGN